MSLSKNIPHLQAGDLAADYARMLYLKTEGLRIVYEEFRAVILNGSIVRDWTQVSMQIKNKEEASATRYGSREERDNGSSRVPSQRSGENGAKAHSFRFKIPPSTKWTPNRLLRHDI